MDGEHRILPGRKHPRLVSPVIGCGGENKNIILCGSGDLVPNLPDAEREAKGHGDDINGPFLLGVVQCLLTIVSHPLIRVTYIVVLDNMLTLATFNDVPFLKFRDLEIFAT